MKRVRAFLLIVLVLVPAAASAATVEQVVALSRAGVSEAVILALIDRDHTIFTLEPEQLATLKQQGVSENIVLAMLRSGRDEGEQAARTEAASRASLILSSLSTSPDVVIVGHGPDRPDTVHPDGFFTVPSGPEVVFPYVPPYVSAYGTPYSSSYASPYSSGYSYTAPAPYVSPFAGSYNSPFAVSRPPLHGRSPCLAPTTTPSGRPGSSLAFVTTCPPALQTLPRRFVR
jgi:hypothetical protein